MFSQARAEFQLIPSISSFFPSAEDIDKGPTKSLVISSVSSIEIHKTHTSHGVGCGTIPTGQRRSLTTMENTGSGGLHYLRIPEVFRGYMSEFYLNLSNAFCHRYGLLMRPGLVQDQ